MQKNKTIYIAQLPQPIQEAIMTDVRSALMDIDLTVAEQEIALQDAMDSRLCDLSDTIDIEKYL
ncbi:hypothetical protein PVOR_01630 [Paenibacillus vortex V453]|uniref:Uncharacterized protein n=1 Tax=Paenibacillus vortex V453 TaxID=715225 RepID=A0A2R9T2T0_9BACL|nr:hypothetical protein [Paenibacillus vortex]EFU43871.1 hypothetical protein PVOR_01630 [Paenibacillus vortex V453]